MSSNVKMPAAFTQALRKWPKGCGTPVTAAQLDAAGIILAGRLYTQKHMALAMYLRTEGATQGQVQAVNAPLAKARNALSLQGDTQVNLYRGLVKAPLAARKVTDVSRFSGTVKVYALTVGAPKASKARKATGKAASAVKATGKARKASKASKATEPAVKATEPAAS